MNNLDIQLENKIKELLKMMLMSKGSINEKEANNDLDKLFWTFKNHEVYDLLKELDENEKIEYITKFEKHIQKIKKRMPRKIPIIKKGK